MRLKRLYNLKAFSLQTPVSYILLVFYFILIGTLIGTMLYIIKANRHTSLGMSVMISSVYSIFIGYTITLLENIGISMARRARIKWLMKLGIFLFFGIVMLIAQITATKVVSLMFNIPARTSYTNDIIFATFYTIIGVLIFIRELQKDNFNTEIHIQNIKLLELQKLKTQAELDALQAKINPHFLYNTLNAIASLIHSNPDKAEKMTLALSRFFRYSTNRQNRYYSTIQEEIEMIETYLEIERTRFEDRLEFRIIAEEGTEKYYVPHFLLQPLVENAVKHGIAEVEDNGLIEVKIEKVSEHLIITIHDNGRDFPEMLGTGYGIKSVKDKLALLYKDDAEIYWENHPRKQIVIVFHKPLLHEPTNI